MYQKIKNIFHLLNAITAACWYQFPGKKLTVIGVTGTSGKTTTAHMLYEVLKASRVKVSLISTISAIINEKSIDTGFHVTTPSPWTLQKLIRDAQKGGSQYLILEVTSHALDQYRVWGTSIDIAIITNITHEHLDYHKTFENYRNTKARILKGTKCSILNYEDPAFSFLKKNSSGMVITYGLSSEADVSPKNVSMSLGLPGIFNYLNALSALAVGRYLGLSNETSAKALEKFSLLEGRMEEIANHKNIRIIIDFAHKPDALEQVLKTARTMTKKNVIVMFGCAGLRDRLKRPMMGEIASRLANYAVFTAEDPRSEDVRDIINQIAKGALTTGLMSECKKSKRYSLILGNQKLFWKIPDRQEAINFILRTLAKPGDVVLLCGKGHERSMCYGKKEYPWNEHKAVQKALHG